MINNKLKNQIDNIYDVLWSGGISDPLELIEQIANLLFLRILDNLHKMEEKELTGPKSPFENRIFPEGNDPKGRPYEDLRWSHFKHFPPPEMFTVVKEHVFPFLHTLGTDNTKYVNIKDARFTIPTPALLSKVVYLLDSIPMENYDTKVDLYEYIFSKIATTGKNGQYFTPSQIIQLIVEKTGSQPKEVVCDPARGTAGFLLATATQRKLSKLRKIGFSSVEELTTTLQKEDIHFSASEFPFLGRAITTTLGKKSGIFPIPEWLSIVFSTIAQGRTVNSICDPYARIGLLIGIIQEATQAKSVIAYTLDNSEAALGKVLVGNAEWRVKNPIDLLSSLTDETDIVASILPWGAKMPQSNVDSPYDIEFKYDFGHLILIEASKHLSTDGIGLFVVTPSFFFSPCSVLPKFDALGLGLEAALELPPGTFAPQTNIPSYLVIVRKHPLPKMFVARLSSDSDANLRILSNLAKGKEGDSIELGRFVDVHSFRGLDAIRLQERFEAAKNQFGSPALSLEELATSIKVGNYRKDFQFSKQENAIFIPLFGTTDVLESLDNITLRSHNYAQVAIDSTRSDARFVARFLNSDFGKEIREISQCTSGLPKLNIRTLKGLQVFLPDLHTQKAMMKIETRIAAEQNTLLGLQNELEQLRRDLWTKPQSASDIDKRLSVFSNRFSADIKQHTAVNFDQWINTLPFPLSSILSVWQATDSNNFKEKYLRLLDFFEATVEFLSIILLSAFISNESFFEPHWQKLIEPKKDHKLSFQVATFGTWRTVLEYLGKQTRELLNDEKEGRKLCMEMFSDPSLRLPTVISDKRIVSIFSTTNKMRNDWKGHGGAVGEKEAEYRHEQLLGEIQKLQSIMADFWTEIELIRSLYCTQSFDEFENEVAIMMGTNSEFKRKRKNMATSLDKNYLYLSKKDSNQALKLIPLMQFGPCAKTPENACYFYSKAGNKNLKYVSYHFTDPSDCEVPIDTKMSEQLRIFWESR